MVEARASKGASIQPRKRIRRACNPCRSRRSRCDGRNPCSECTDQERCIYEPVAKRVSGAYVRKLEEQLRQVRHERSPQVSTPVNEPGICPPQMNANAGSNHVLTPESLNTTVTPCKSVPSLSSRVVSNLLNEYYTLIHPIFPVLMWSEFSGFVSRVWDGSPDESQNCLSLAQLYLALACVIQMQPSQAVGSCSAEEYFNKAKVELPMDVLLGKPSLDLIRCHLLLALYGQISARPYFSVNSVIVAIQMMKQLNLNQVAKDPVKRDLRGRIWTCCVKLDFTVNVTLGKQPFITEKDCDSFLLPLADGEWHDPPSPGVSEVGSDACPSKLVFTREATKLYYVAISALNRVYSNINRICDLPDIQNVVALDERLQRWKKELPPFLVPENHILRLGRQWLDRQTEILNLRFLHVKVIIHRISLFYICHLPSSEFVDEIFSVEICCKSAHKAAEAASELLDMLVVKFSGKFSASWWHNMGYLYTSCLVLLAHRIACVSHPRFKKLYKVEKSIDSDISRALKVLNQLANGEGSKYGHENLNKTGASITSSRMCQTANRCLETLREVLPGVQHAEISRSSQDALTASENIIACTSESSPLAEGNKQTQEFYPNSSASQRPDDPENEAGRARDTLMGTFLADIPVSSSTPELSSRQDLDQGFSRSENAPLKMNNVYDVTAGTQSVACLNTSRAHENLLENLPTENLLSTNGIFDFAGDYNLWANINTDFD